MMRNLTTLVLSLLLAVVVAGCGQSSVTGANAASGGPKTAKVGASAAGVTLRVGVQKDGLRPLLESSGALAGVPYKIEWSVFQFGPPLVEAVGADKIDVAEVGSTPPLFGAASRAAKFRVIAQTQFKDEAGSALLVTPESKIKKAVDLKGKTVAIPKGSSAHGFFLNYLDRNGISIDDVKIQYLAPADGLAAFSMRRVDAWPIWQPYITQGKSEGGRSIAGGAPDEDGYEFLVASTGAVEDPARAAALKDFLERLKTGFEWADRNPEKWAEAWTNESGLPIETTKPAAIARLQTLGPITDETRASQQKLADVLNKYKVIPVPVKFDDIVTTGLAPGE